MRYEAKDWFGRVFHDKIERSKPGGAGVFASSLQSTLEVAYLKRDWKSHVFAFLAHIDLLCCLFVLLKLNLEI